MADFLKLYRSGRFTDHTGAMAQLLNDHRMAGMENARGTGMSTLLSTLRYFLDRREDTGEVFDRLEIAGWQKYREYLNSWDVLALDFSDFEGKNMNAALSWFRHKMAALYREHSSAFFLKAPEGGCEGPFWCETEAFLQVVQETERDDVLAMSLRSLISRLLAAGWDETLENGKKNEPSLALLIDQVNRPEKVAGQYGYEREMKAFFRQFAREDVYKYANFTLLVADDKPEQTGAYSSDWYSMGAFTVFPRDPRTHWPELIVPREKQYELPQPSLAARNPAETAREQATWEARLKEQEGLVEACRQKEQERKAWEKEAERQRFLEELSPAFPRPSANLGMRTLAREEIIGLPGYDALETALQELYADCQGNLNLSGVYRTMQRICRDRETDLTEEPEIYVKEDLKDVLHGPWRKVWTNRDSSWNYYSFSPKEHAALVMGDGIKAHLSFDSPRIRERLTQILSHLISVSDTGFSVKQAKHDRTDHVCFWLTKEDLLHVTSYLGEHDMGLNRMQWMACRHGAGITRDLNWDESHHTVLAELMSGYFMGLRGPSDVCFVDMLDRFVRCWNGELADDHGSKAIRNMRASSFLVIMDTMDILLGRHTLEDPGTLLLGSSDEIRQSDLVMTGNAFWDLLEEAKNWGELNESLKDLKTDSRSQRKEV